MEVSKAAISKWETGRTEPGISALTRLRRLYALDGLTLDWLVAGVTSSDASATTAEPMAHVAQNGEEALVLRHFRALTPAQRKGLLNVLAPPDRDLPAEAGASAG